MTTEGKVSPLPLPISVRSHGAGTRMCDLTFAEGLAGHIQIWRDGVLGTQEEIDALAAFIVRAANSHEALVAALKKARQRILFDNDEESEAFDFELVVLEIDAALAAEKGRA